MDSLLTIAWFPLMRAYVNRMPWRRRGPAGAAAGCASLGLAALRGGSGRCLDEKLGVGGSGERLGSLGAPLTCGGSEILL